MMHMNCLVRSHVLLLPPLRPGFLFLMWLCLLPVLCSGTAMAQEAYVYDYMPNKGVYVYDASSTGKITAIKGSPFKITGQMMGTNGKYVVSADSTNLYSYEVESNGAIGKKVSDINTQLYSGSECGTIALDVRAYSSAVAAVKYDHSGQNVYVLLYGAEGDGNGACDGMQTYGVSKSGVFTFKGVTEVNQESSMLFSGMLPTLTGNGKFGLGYQFNEENGDLCDGTTLNLFATESGGTLLYEDNLSSWGPTPQPGYTWLLQSLTDDATDHMAMAMNSTTDPDCEDSPTFGPSQLASYTVDSQGNLTTTNTYETMPSLPEGNNGAYLMKLDPSGKFLAVATGTGVAFFHFNGGAPITPFTGIIGVSGHITLMDWDNDGHLYAQNGNSGKLHVYAATAKSVKELSGSPTVIPYSFPYSSIMVRTK